MVYKFRPSVKQCLEVDSVFRERLQDSLSYIFDEAVDDSEYKKALNDSLVCDIKHRAWKFSALNSYLIEILSNNSEEVDWKKLVLEINSEPDKQPKILTLGDLSNFERSMVLKYATTGDDSIILSDDERKTSTANVDKAMAVMREYAPEYYDEVEILTDGILVCKTDSFESGSSFDLAKLIYIRAEFDLSMDAIFRTIKRIVHENAHMFLHLLSIDDEMVENPMSELFQSPFRKDPRPMMGIFHAHFVIFRLIDLIKDNRFGNLLHKNGISFKEELQSLKNQLSQTAHVISQHAKLTPLGQDIFKNSNMVI